MDFLEAPHTQVLAVAAVLVTGVVSTKTPATLAHYHLAKLTS